MSTLHSGLHPFVEHAVCKTNAAASKQNLSVEAWSGSQFSSDAKT